MDKTSPSIVWLASCRCVRLAQPRLLLGLFILATLLAGSDLAVAQSKVRIETLAGNGQAGLADGDAQAGQFNRPHGLAIDGKDSVYVSDRGNHAVRVVSANGHVRTLAGSGKEGNADGIGAAASFKQPIAVAVDKAGNVYVADRDNHIIRLIDPSGK